MNKRLIVITTIALATLLCSASCKGKKTSSESMTQEDSLAMASIPSPFVADSAMAHIRKQVEFGPRVPNTDAHRACAEYLSNYLRSQGMSVTDQRMKLTAWDNTQLDAVNIIGSHNPDATTRLLLFAHWDTRPLADHDKDRSRRQDPIDGADDGASGVGVLMEIARLLKEQDIKHLGVDIIFFDAEDYGVPNDVSYEGNSAYTWALGTQYWAKNPHLEGYKAEFGILLDMVGAKDATFYREQYSQEHAGRYVSKIWETAARLGHSNYFKNEMGGAVTDDHVFVINDRRIPCVDIINYDPNSRNGFGDYWHTHQDNLENISTATLNAVGRTVWQIVTDFEAALVKKNSEQ